MSSVQRQKIVAGNWKMFTTPARARELATRVVAKVGESSKVRVAVCPPFPFLSIVGEIISDTNVGLGAQNAYFENEGAFTGEVSPIMLRDLGCQYVILGHSERRHVLGESDELVQKKVKACLEAGLQVILCLGETLDEREQNQTEAVLERQLVSGLELVAADEMSRMVFAYEPVWAIGTGKTAAPDQAQEAHAFLRGRVATRFDEDVASALQIQYGGSVKPGNAADIFSQPDVDGGLIGGASLKADDFAAIIDAAKK